MNGSNHIFKNLSFRFFIFTINTNTPPWKIKMFSLVAACCVTTVIIKPIRHQHKCVEKAQMTKLSHFLLFQDTKVEHLIS